MMAKLFAYITSSIMVLMSVGIVYFAFFEETYVVYLNQPFPVQSPVKAGSYTYVHVMVCNQSDKSVSLRLQRLFEHKTDPNKNQLLPALDPLLKPGCIDTMRKSATPIAIDTEPGWYRYNGAISYEGLVRRHTMPWVSEYFEVVPP